MNYLQLESNDQNPTATIKTTLGDITLTLYPEVAPKAVKNFIELSQSGYYDGVIFHRVIPNFMIQGGDPTGTGRGGESIYGSAFEDEFSNQVFNFNGALSMANAGPNTNGSQFFIVSAQEVPQAMLDQMKALSWPEEVIETYAQKGGTPWLDHKHTVFGQVVDGMDVVYQIEAVERDSHDKPLEDVSIVMIDIEGLDQ
ncbi:MULTISPECIES: peptidylprolyl isomerase [Aerococcus]|uniref:peptidylprolyl isomerase n=1 Tax=Aerococcus TaxID=1375 RepID=UPI0018A6F826|nr:MULTISPECIES: peptidylprolyl isomerase [Aerococcus]MCY3036515.1 peptidylprolyl isomerase [Aerococcus sp. Group 2]MCY3039476.1 peptidylprolyl isomerase [Aerococcus sp. Group 2]MCY3041378.1 peptidylprolyl isomerase [Aerococcus sp. Group 2]MCY3042930.1 peptidylprolyl isomerase [Aerococcus sp. Group 2]MDK6520571.1 peptidylprolyl isomerase [Aerococcus urinae]